VTAPRRVRSGRFEGQTILVTGAGSGMGRAEAVALAGEGARVWATDIDVEAAKAVEGEVTTAGGYCRAQEHDVADPSSWQQLAAAVMAESGRLHGLVNNAGISFRSGIVDTSVEDWRRVLDVNLSSVFYGMKYLADPLRRAGGASVVNVSSIAGLLGYFSASYGASKWAVRGISKVGALEFAADQVRVNSVHPGLVDTPLLHSGPDDRFVRESLRAVPAARVASPDEVAAVVAFLLCDEAAYVNGTELVVDGGMVSGGLYHRITNDLSEAGA
jgi:3alpha(or 20beta)-hydroxysteroid dehydrogenase